MSIQEQFEKFYENIKLTSSQREDAITKHTGVCTKLHDYYYPEIEYNGNTKLLIGSYGKQTHIRPARDIDVIFIMPLEKFEQYDDNQSNSQSQLLQDIKSILAEKYPDTPIKAFGKVVVLEFADTKHDVELLPAWEKEDGTFIIPNSENGGYWEYWDPRSEIKKITDSDSKTSKTKSLIRMIKKWSENCSTILKSFEIENKVLDFFSNSDSSGKEYPILIKDFFDYFHQTSTDNDLKSHINTALNRAIKACDFEKENNQEKAIDEWRKIFGDDFPATIEKCIDITELMTNKIERLKELYPSEKEEFINTTYGIEFALNSAYQLKIDAHVTQDGFRPAWLSFFLQKNFPLKKKKKLIFSIIKNNIPPSYSIMWKVRNFGDEAKDAADLRGEITNDKGLSTKEENTKYYGEHYVECYIIKNNLCVAMDRILVPIDKN